MSEDKSKLQLIGEIAQANNKNLELIEELNNKEDEIERLNNKVDELMTLYTTEREVKEDYKSIIKEVREYIDRRDIEWGSKEYNYVLEILDKEKIIYGDKLKVEWYEESILDKGE